MGVKGYKVFNPDWTCSPTQENKKQYTCPGIFEKDVELEIGKRGIHFCEEAIDCFNYSSFRPDGKVAEVISYGDIIKRGGLCCTNKIVIIREVSWKELLNIVNFGKNCVGRSNIGNNNFGDFNVGDSNIGDLNVGNFNEGFYNSRNCNKGDSNSGSLNIGDFNSGFNNIGSYNTGNNNIGKWNSGDWNKCNFSNGCFNTINPKIYLFNKPSEWTYYDWLNSKAYELLDDIELTSLEYVNFSDMTDEEKATYPETETTGDYLKKVGLKENAVIWWSKLTKEEKKVITEIPNFDKEIFKEIMGIDIEEDI